MELMEESLAHWGWCSFQEGCPSLYLKEEGKGKKQKEKEKGKGKEKGKKGKGKERKKPMLVKCKSE